MIRVNEDYIITADSMNYTAYYDLKKTNVNKDGVETMSKRLVGYYNTPQKALEGIMRHEVSERVKKRDMNLAEFVEVIKDVDKEMRKLLEGLNLDLAFDKGE